MNSQEQKQSLDDIQNESSQSFNNSDLNTIESIESTNVVATQTVTNCAIWHGHVECKPIVNQENVELV